MNQVCERCHKHEAVVLVEPGPGVVVARCAKCIDPLRDLWNLLWRPRRPTEGRP